ncbi:hypothetical protein OIU84_029052, partial [Salix udensis]
MVLIARRILETFFQILIRSRSRELGKVPCTTNLQKIKFLSFQDGKNNPVPSAPAPLVWKNRYAYNEVPRRKENEHVEVFYPRINREPNNYNQSLASTSSSEKASPQGFKSSSNFNPSNKESDTRNYASSASSALSSDPSQCYSFLSAEEANSNLKENKPWEATFARANVILVYNSYTIR